MAGRRLECWRDQKDLNESFAEHVGTYGEYSLELDGQNGPTLVTPRGRKALVLVQSGDAITNDMVYRIRFGGGELDVTVAGGGNEQILQDWTSTRITDTYMSENARKKCFVEKMFQRY